MKINRYKLLVFLSILTFLYIGIYVERESHLVASLSIFLFIIIWLLISDLLKRLKHREIVRFLKSVGSSCEPDDMLRYKSGYVNYKGVWATGSISVAKKGIKIYFLGVGNLLIEWGKIKKGAIVKVGDNILFALDIYHNDSVTDRFLVPNHPKLAEKWN